MNQFFAYIRVSTSRQGEHGVSLQQQRDSINWFAKRNGFEILQWFEEQETAAKRGRPVFGQMLRALRKGTVCGVLIHKIDRSARNLKDWADLGELIDAGIQVHFANEALDLTSRGGRLSADIQAVVAADYIRNLREETKKGFYGRLKQGILPMPAPIGYQNIGPAKPKEVDPTTGPVIRQLFERYAGGGVNFATLLQDTERLDLRGRSGKPLTKNGLSKILNNPFYAGIIKIQKTNETFYGAHEPLITKALFDRVQDVLHGRVNARSSTHDFLFRRRFVCKACGSTLIGETHKGYIYYRCQQRDCATTSIREDFIESALLDRFRRLRLLAEERHFFKEKSDILRSDSYRYEQNAVDGLKLRLAQCDERLDRLTDAVIDNLLDRDSFEQRKASLIADRRNLEDALAEWLEGKRNPADEIGNILERADIAYSAYKSGNPVEKRDVVDTLTSNRFLNAKTLEFSLRSPFHVIANRFQSTDGSPQRDVHRTSARLWETLLQLVHRERKKLRKNTSFPRQDMPPFPPPQPPN